MEPRVIKLGKLLRKYRGYKIYLTKRRSWTLAGWSPNSKIIGVSPDILELPPEYQRRIIDHEIKECEFFNQHQDKLLQAAHNYAVQQTGLPDGQLILWTEKRFKRKLQKEELIPW